MNILTVSTSDIGGGAERVAWTLSASYRDRGHGSWLAVGHKRSSDPGVIEIPRFEQKRRWVRPIWALHGRLEPAQGIVPGITRARRWLHIVAAGQPERDLEQGFENFHFPGSRHLLSLPPVPPDIVHCHNLHGGYFDLRYLAELSSRVPAVLTLHDEWLLTGHCACTIGCPRWEYGCGKCPDLASYPGIRRDGTAANWRRKQSIYARSTLHVATPSRWLYDLVQRSMLKPVETRVIPYGIDLSVFKPADRAAVRWALGVPADANVLLYAANNVSSNPWKDYTTIREAVARVGRLPDSSRPIHFIALGSQEENTSREGNVSVQHVPFISNSELVAQYFQAADIYLHAARTDNFPNVVLEALACGTPVVATAVGGIPEQIRDGLTGFLVPPADGEAMAERILRLLGDEDLRRRMGISAAEDARERFDLNQQVEKYLNWYQELLGNKVMSS